MQNSSGTGSELATTKARTGKKTDRRRQPYAWLGAGALTLGVGVALAGAGAAHADDSATTSSAAAAKTQSSTPAAKPIRHTSGPKAKTRTATTSSAKPTPSAGALTPTAVSTPRPVKTTPVASGPRTQAATTPAVAYVTHPAPPLNPNDFGPVLGTVVRIVNEIHYVITDQKPIVKPFQLPSAPNQSVIVGTLGAYTANGDPYAATITGAPTKGTVAIDAASGAYVYTPNAALATTGGTDTFTITATDTANHPLAGLLEHLFGIAAHSTTATVSVTVAAATATTDTTAYYITNTSYQNLQIAGYAVNQAALSPAVGQVIQSPATASNGDLTQALFQIADGKTVTVYLNPVGVIHEGVIQNYSIKNPLTSAVSADGSYLYVTGGDNGVATVSVIDTTTGLIAATIPVGTDVSGIVITPDGSRLYVRNSGSATVSVIDTASKLITASISVPGNVNPFGIAISPDGKYVYTANGDNTVSVISANPTDPQYNTVTASIDIGVGFSPRAIAVSPDSTKVYVINYSDDTKGNLTVIDTASNTIVATAAGIPYSVDLAVSPDGTRIYVTDEPTNASYSNGYVTVLNAATLGIETTIQIGYPVGLAVSPDGKHLVVANAGNPFEHGTSSVAVIDTDTASPDYNTVVNSYSVGDGALGVTFSSDGTSVYVTSAESGTVARIGVATSGKPDDGGTASYVVTMTGGATPTCSATGGNQCPTGGTNTYLEDAPGTVYHIPSDQAQEQSDVLQNLVDDDTSNATFYSKSPATIGYTNPLKAQGFSPYINNTTSASTSTYTTTTTTSTATSTTWSVSVKTTEEAKMGDLTFKAEESATDTWGTTTTNTATYTQTVTQTVQPGETLYLYTETPVQRFYGDWTVVYGNTTYTLENVWYDTPYAANSIYPSYIAAYTCQTGSAQCSQLASGDLSGYPDSFPTSAPTYPVAESNPDSSYTSGTAILV